MQSLTKSKIFLYFCLSFVLGVSIASFAEIPILTLFAAAIASIISISIFWREKKLIVAGFCLIFLILGIYRFQSISDGKNYISRFNDSKENIVFQGTVSEEPDIRIKNTQYVITVQNLNVILRPASPKLQRGEPNRDIGQERNDKRKNLGKVLVTLPHYPAYQYGDLIELEGKLKSPAEFDSFSYKDYLAKDDIYSVMYSPAAKLISRNNEDFIYAKIFKIKNRFKEKIEAIVPEPENSLLAGLLLGERSGLSQKLKDDFSATGTSHIVAVSGFNVTIIAIIILELALLLGFSRSQSFWISIATIILFIIMVGAPSSAIRAGVMGGLVLLATHTGRLNSAFSAVVFAAVLMVAANPAILRFDVGFQLSFLAVIGIVWLYPILDNCCKKIPDFLKVKSMLLVTISAQIMTLPILIYDFRRLSLIAPIANILILPFVPLAMVLGFLAGASGFIWMSLAEIIGYFAWLVLTYQIRTIEFLASLSWAAAEVNAGVTFLILYYLAIVIILVKMRYRKVSY